MGDKRDISKSDILNLQISSYGVVETLRHHYREMNKNIALLETAVNDQNPMALAKAVGAILAVNDTIKQIIFDGKYSVSLDKMKS